jgi:hypothetical protein
MPQRKLSSEGEVAVRSAAFRETGEVEGTEGIISLQLELSLVMIDLIVIIVSQGNPA